MSTPVPTVFLCMPLTADAEHTVEQHIENAKLVACKVLELGGYPICPHTNTGWMFGQISESEELIVTEALQDLAVSCDIFFHPIIPGFTGNGTSKGCRAEEDARIERRWLHCCSHFDEKDTLVIGDFYHLKNCINMWKEAHQ